MLKLIKILTSRVKLKNANLNGEKHIQDGTKVMEIKKNLQLFGMVEEKVITRV